MRLLLLLVLLAGCASDEGGQPGSVHARVNGVYTTYGGVGVTH